MSDTGARRALLVDPRVPEALHGTALIATPHALMSDTGARRALLVDPRVPEIRSRVEAFAASFPMPGFVVGDDAPACNGAMANGKHA